MCRLPLCGVMKPHRWRGHCTTTRRSAGRMMPSTSTSTTSSNPRLLPRRPQVVLRLGMSRRRPTSTDATYSTPVPTNVQPRALGVCKSAAASVQPARRQIRTSCACLCKREPSLRSRSHQPVGSSAFIGLVSKRSPWRTTPHDAVRLFLPVHSTPCIHLAAVLAF